MKSRAQVSMEYQAILIIGIVVVLIGVKLVSMFWAVDKTQTDQGDVVYWRTAEVGFTDWLISESGAGRFSLRNNLDSMITVSSVQVGSGRLLGTPLTLAPGKTRILDGAVGSGGEVTVSYKNKYGLEKKFRGARQIISGAAVAGVCRTPVEQVTAVASEVRLGWENPTVTEAFNLNYSGVPMDARVQFESDDWSQLGCPTSLEPCYHCFLVDGATLEDSVVIKPDGGVPASDLLMFSAGGRELTVKVGLDYNCATAGMGVDEVTLRNVRVNVTYCPM